MSLYLGTTPIAVNSSSREIGEIIQSTIPLTDAGLHLLDGSVISGSGAYSAFVTHIAGLVSGHSELFTTEANWQTSNDNYGACDKFVYDSVNNTVRLPKRVTDHGVLIKSYSAGTDWYRIYSDGWCEQGGIISAIYGQNISVTLLKNYKDTNYQVQTTYNTTAAGATSGAYSAANLKTTSSFAIGSQGGETAWQASGYTDISDLQQTPVYEYIVIANTVKTPVEVDIDEVMTDLNGKADVDLSNMNPTQTVKNTIVGWGMPDYTAGVAKTWNTDITTTQDVRVCYGGASQNQVGDSIRLYINNNLVGNYIIASAGVFMQWVDIPAEVTYKVTGGQWGQYITEYPFLGE